MRVPGFGQTYPIEFLDNNKLAGERNTVLLDLRLQICGFLNLSFFFFNDTEMSKSLITAYICMPMLSSYFRYLN